MTIRIAIIALLLVGCDSVFGLRSVDKPDDAAIDAAIATGWKAVAASYNHTCGIRADDTVWCWGGNDSQEIGIASPAGIVLEPTKVGDRRFVTISSRYLHTCAIDVEQALWCWGTGSYGGLGTGTFVAPLPQRIDGEWKQVALGAYSSCGIRTDDSLWCWGWNAAYGEVGTGLTMQQPEPVRIGSATWLDVDIGWYHSCGIQSDHSLWCWGTNYYGAFGDGPPTNSFTPRLITGAAWDDVGVTELSTCGRTTSGAMRCWGYGLQGQLGNGSAVGVTTPTPVAVDGIDVEDWVSVSAGDRHVCGIRNDGSLWCWGENVRGQLAIPTADAPRSLVPVRITGGATQWRRVDAAQSTTCAIDVDNNLWCWGGNARNQLGDGASLHPAPTLMPGTASVLATGMNQTCIIDAASRASCSGFNTYGGLGDGTQTHRSTLTPIVGPPASGWTVLAPGTNHGCGIAGGVTYCWGYNGNKALGDGSAAITRLTPGPVTGTFSALASADHTCALSGQAAYCWGYNIYGQIGNNTQVDQGTPYPSVASNVDQIVVGHHHSCARAISTGGVVCWGRNFEGEIGNGTNTHALLPVAAMTAAAGPIKLIAAGGYHTCGIATTNLLWCWGSNSYGELGLGDRAPRNVAVQVGTAQWRTVAMGSWQTCGIRTDNSLWCWGRNARGTLGIGTFLDRSLPVRVGTDADWVTLTAGFEHFCATKAGGAFYCWGGSDYGQIPDGLAWNPTPVMVP